MNTHKKHIFRTGFTIIELLVVISVIGILVTLVVVSYNGVQANARDKSILSDLDALDGQETRCGLNKTSCGIVSTLAAKAWYSPSGVDSFLQFTPSPGNVIDIVANSTDYCIRGYNLTAATYTKISLAATKESTTGVCASIAASAAAIAGSP